ncbi:MAG: hypothetical protein JXL84_09255 [Deltaproteobacteria bacterium]|nr:hypothetical protein [Deltaproteobacteria bacterium]
MIDEKRLGPLPKMNPDPPLHKYSRQVDLAAEAKAFEQAVNKELESGLDNAGVLRPGKK